MNGTILGVVAAAPGVLKRHARRLFLGRDELLGRDFAASGAQVAFVALIVGVRRAQPALFWEEVFNHNDSYLWYLSHGRACAVNMRGMPPNIVFRCSAGCFVTCDVHVIGFTTGP